MSYSDLMGHAAEIQRKAVDKAIEDLGGRRHSRSYMSEKRPEIEAQFADIPALFAPFTQIPEPGSFDPPIASMGRVLGVLSSGQTPKDPISDDVYPANIILDKVPGAESYIEDWTGKAAMDFKSFFIDPFPSVVSNQFTVAAILKAGLEAEKSLWSGARTDIDTIAHKVLAALDNMDDCGKNEWTIGFTVLASIAFVGATVFTGGTAAPIAFTVAGGVFSTTAAAPPMSDPEPNRYSGESPAAVIAEMRAGIGDLTRCINEQERRIADSISKNHDLIATDRTFFVSPRPALADATPGSVRDGAYLGYPT
jgi:hypothetical protein